LDNHHNIKDIKDYFSLWGPRPVMGGAGSADRRQIFLFVGVVLGALSKVLYDSLTGGTVGWKEIALALIGGIVVFPKLYYSGGLSRRKLTFVHWMLAFQNGFFWSVTFDALAKKLGGK
jgi:hypothetical protein